MPRARPDLRGVSSSTGLAAVIVVLAGLAVYLTARYGFPWLSYIARDNGNAYDFGIFYRSTVALWTGGDIYPTGQPNFSPPATMVALGPLALLAPTAAYRVFVVVSVAALLAGLAWLGHTVRLNSSSAVVASGMFLISPAMLDTLAQGQIYALLSLGLVAAWVLDRYGRDRSSGVALGLVVAFKPVFAAVVLWPLLRRRRDSFIAALATAAAVTIAGLVIAGPAASLRYLEVLRAGFPHKDLANASLLTTGLRLFTPGRDAPPLLDAPLLGWTVAFAAVSVLALTLARGGRSDLWAITAACLIASPLAWRGYLVVLYPGVLLLLSNPRTRTVAVASLIALSVPYTWSAAWTDQQSVGYILSTLLLPITLLGLWAAVHFVSDEDRLGRVEDEFMAERVSPKT